MTGEETDPANGADDSGHRTTRRNLLAFTGLTGLALTASGSSLPRSRNRLGGLAADTDGVVLNGDLDVQGNDIEEVSDILTASKRASLHTPGSGDGSVEIRDAAADAWSMRATEGAADSPGPVEFQAPVRGGTSGEGEPSLQIEGGADVGELSIDSWNVVDVTEHGVTPDSGTDLGAFVQSHFGRDDVSNAVYYLPEGTYEWNTAVTAESFDGFGLIGKPQARVKCTNPEMTHFLMLGGNSVGLADLFYAENVTFDIQTDDVAASAIIAAVDEFLHIDNCRLVGEMDRNYGWVYSIHPTLLKESGRGFVNVTMPDGSFYDPSLPEYEHPMGISIERDHQGHLVIENSEIHGFINNGIYSAGHQGHVAIRNTTVKNCGGGMLRLGDGDYAYKCHLINNDAEDRGYSYAALWVNKARSAVADSILIRARQRTPSELVRVTEEVGNCALSNFHIESHANQFVCHFTGGESAGSVIATNWTITDHGSAETNAHLGRIDRPNTKIENWDVDIDPPEGGKRHGLIVDAPWVNIMASTFRHTGDGLALLLDDGADYLRLKDSDFKSGTLYQYDRATVEEAIVVDNRFAADVELAGEQINWTTRGHDL